MGSKDLPFMLEQRPTNMMLIGNGYSAGIHNTAFDFNDAAIPFGIAYLHIPCRVCSPRSNRAKACR